LLQNWPNKKYDVIVVDPPWPMKKIVRRVRPNQAETFDYRTMSIAEIEQLPISSISNDNAVIFLWSVQKYLPPAFDILKKYGFKYQRVITWDKKDGVCFFGFHHRTEFVLFGYKGSLDMYPSKKAMPTIITEKSKGHSIKPDCFYEWASTFGETCIDLFARKRRPGWDAWGDEV